MTARSSVMLPRRPVPRYTASSLLLAVLLLLGCATDPQPVPAQSASARIADSWTLDPSGVDVARSQSGMVATTDRVASEIGAEILRRGGNAIDAAIAVHFALAVVNPEAGNIGGGGFLVAHLTDGTSVSLDFRETAPLAATRDMYLDESGEPTDRSVVGHLASGVPGSVAGMWEAHQRFGTLPWSELVEPAIALAEGFVVHERLALSFEQYGQRFHEHPAAAAIFLKDGRPLRVGERLVQSDLAETLRRIARDGADGFYRGETARLIEAEMRRGGGIITGEDLAAYRAIWRDPVIFDYRGHSIIAMPPPSSGGPTLALLLNILEGYELSELGFLSADHAHLFAEAARRAYVDRNTYLADPDFVDVPTLRMASDEYAAERRQTIDLTRATPSDSVTPGLGEVGELPAAESSSTTQYSVVDGQGNAVSVTTTLNALYGSRVMVTGAGFFLNDEMDDFAVKPGEPNMFGLVQGMANMIEPGKRMLSSMTPSIVLDASGQVVLVTGTPGGATIITTVAQMISNVIDWELDPAAATAAPRLHHQHLPDVLHYENGGLSEDVVIRLRAMGHDVRERTGYSGDAQTIGVAPDGTLVGAADGRRGGAAVGVRAGREVLQ